MGAAIDYTYLYPFASGMGGAGLRLATCSGMEEHPHFFDGSLRRPREFGQMLFVLSEVVRTHFFLPRPQILDPVVTCGDSKLRFEGFSGCCGVYVRADFGEEAFETEFRGRGTTNVDFNNPMRSALSRLRDQDETRLAVGAEGVDLERNGERVVEKKVRLPVRWLKGFCEVQAYQPRLELRLEIPGDEARRFVREIPRQTPKAPSYVTQTGRTLRLSQRAKPGAVRLTGTHRVRVLEPLMGGASGLRIWSDDDAGTSAWEVVFESGRLFLMISPDVYRGFSGEGQALSALSGDWEAALPKVRAHLGWQSEIDLGKLARVSGASEGEVESALAALGARGLAGFDASAGVYFHREMPFDMEQVESLQPRLKAARKLVETGGVERLEASDSEIPYGVRGTGVTHYVRLRGDRNRCSCPWHSRHQGQRGPCKHILAARIVMEGDEDPAAGARASGAGTGTGAGAERGA